MENAFGMKSIDEINLTRDDLKPSRPGAVEPGKELQGPSTLGAVTGANMTTSGFTSNAALATLLAVASCPLLFSCAREPAGTMVAAEHNTRTILGASSGIDGISIAKSSCSHLHSGSKRVRTLAFPCNASLQTEPTLPSHLQQVASVQRRLGEDSIGNGPFEAASIWQGSDQTEHALTSSCAEDEASVGQLQQQYEVLLQLRSVASSATTGDPSRGNTTALTTKPGKLTMPYSPGQQEYIACGAERQTTWSGPFHTLYGPADAARLVTSCASADAIAVGHRRLDGWASNMVDDISANTSCSAGDACLSAATGSHGQGNHDLRRNESDVHPTGSGSKGTVGAAPGGMVVTMLPTAARVNVEGLAASKAWMQGEAAATPAGGSVDYRNGALPPDAPSSQPVEPISAQLGAALLPEVAARLKKRIRIIQPISEAWEQETLQFAAAISFPDTILLPRRPPAAAAAAAGHLPVSADSPAIDKRDDARKSQRESSAVAPTVAAHDDFLHRFTAGGVLKDSSLSMPPKAAPTAVSVTDQPSLTGAAESWEPTRNTAAVPAATTAPDQFGGHCDTTQGGFQRHMAKSMAAAASPTLPATARPTAVPQQALPVAAASVAIADTLLHLSTLAPALAALVALPATDGLSHLSANYLPPVPSPLSQTAAEPVSSSAAAALLLRQNGSSIATLTAAPMSASPATDVSPFSSSTVPPFSPSTLPPLSSSTLPPLSPSTLPPLSSSILPPGYRSDDLRSEGGLPASAAVPTEGMAPAAAHEPIRSGPEALATLLAAPAKPGPGETLTTALANISSCDTQEAVRSDSAVVPWLVTPQAVASVAAPSSASCLSKVHGELGLLYQWYISNKTMYLEHAQRQLQRMEALNAARRGAECDRDDDSVAAACARGESAEAVRAFQTALKITSICGSVEQQWLSPAAAVVATPATGYGPAAAMQRPAVGASGLPVPAAASVRNGRLDSRLLSPSHPRSQEPGGADVGSLEVSMPAPSSTWAHGVGAALAVAAALVGFVTRGQSMVAAPGAPDLLSLGEPATALGSQALEGSLRPKEASYGGVRGSMVLGASSAVPSAAGGLSSSRMRP